MSKLSLILYPPFSTEHISKDTGHPFSSPASGWFTPLSFCFLSISVFPSSVVVTLGSSLPSFQTSVLPDSLSALTWEHFTNTFYPKRLPWGSPECQIWSTGDASGLPVSSRAACVCEGVRGGGRCFRGRKCWASTEWPLLLP